MMIASPASMVVASQARSFSRLPSWRRTQFSPTCPGSPPQSPTGRTRRWPDRSVHSIGSRTLRARRTPAPAFPWPRPPEPARRGESSRTTRERLGSIEVARLLRRGAGEIDGRLARLPVDADLHLDPGALVHLIGERAIVQPVDDPAHAFGRVVLHMPHIGLDHRQGELRNHLAQLVGTLLVGGDLRLEIVDVLPRLTCRIFGAGEQSVELALAKSAAIDQLELVDIDAFLLDGGRVGRHRAGRDAADIGVMAAARDPEQDSRAGVLENRRPPSNAGQGGTAVIRSFPPLTIPRPPPPPLLPQYPLPPPA